EYAPKAHFEVGVYARNKADILIAVGPLSIHTKQGWDHARSQGTDETAFWFSDKDKALDFISHLLQRGDVYLVKASRGMQFESIVDVLRELGNSCDWG
ncbi:MAG TPA: hypothetical protein PLR48_05060, partial [Bacillota bacterium]|nr:hypothetical protein [Bacillota bacterium]